MISEKDSSDYKNLLLPEVEFLIYRASQRLLLSDYNKLEKEIKEMFENNRINIKQKGISIDD